jgi:hypothetical protein
MRDPRSDAGFVLIGVVIFVLALTILGLSLFSLSGYEAQFLGESRNKQQAFFDASGGIERAKFALISQATLPSVKSNLPREGVVYARAMNTATGDTTGNVDFTSSTPIAIRVLANYQGERCMLQTQYVPKTAPDFYKRLATSFTHLQFNQAYLGPIPPPPPNGNASRTHLFGEVWQNDAPPAGTATWKKPPVGDIPTYVQAPVVIPQPNVTSVIDANWGAPGTQEVHANLLSNPPATINLTGPLNTISYYKTTDLVPFVPPIFATVYNTTTSEIHVQGYAVWMVHNGMRFDQTVKVTGNPSDCLVILCESDGLFILGGGSYYNSIWFFAGLQSDKVPVILVADGRVEIEQDILGISVPAAVSYLSIFAGDISVIGPYDPSNPNGNYSMALQHTPGSAYDSSNPNALIEYLSSHGALPNANTRAQLTSVRGTWTELNPDNPPQN